MDALKYVQQQQQRVEIPDNLKVPDGEVLLFTAVGEGVQIYNCTPSATDASQFAWTFKEPKATLFDDDGSVVATHYGGPTWEATDNSKVVGKVVAKTTPNLDAIAWLLLEVASHEGSGLLSKVTHIRRLYTTGGVAPTDGCDQLHKDGEVRVDYTSLYAFYGSSS